MIHYQTYTMVEADKLVDLWNRSFEHDFPMDQRLWRQNVDSCNKLFPDASVVAVKDGHIVGAIIGKNPNRLSAIFVAPEFRRRGIATELLARAEVAFTGELETKLIVGQDDRHFSPGVPEYAAEAHAFFTARGFVRNEGYACDLIRSLTDWKPISASPAVVSRLKALGIVLQPCTAALVPALLEHVVSNFSDRWLRDTRDRLLLEPGPSEVIVAVEKKTTVVGFCQTYSIRSAYVGPSIYWRSLIGSAYGGLGPIGVSVNRRKIGLGLELLCYGVTKVAETGAKNMVIDWTNLVNFYAKIGFKPWKRYAAYTKSY
jgi:GNAT superfamily N-acetyltransferase